MKVIIAGSRDITNYDIEQVIKDSGFNITEVVCGGANGIDTLGEIWARKNKIPVKYFPALWKDINVPNAVVKQNKYGRGQYNAIAGLTRNTQMANYADALIVIYHPNSRGSLDMLKKAQANNLLIFQIVV